VTEELRFVSSESDAGNRADLAVALRRPDLSRSLIQKLFAGGLAQIEGMPAKAGRRLRAGDMVVVEVRLPPSLSADPEEMALDIIYEDADLAVVNKPPGLAVHPSPGHASGTLVNALVARYPRVAGVGQECRPGIVHRLDKDTSGLMVVALTAAAHATLQRQIASRSVEREYLALASGDVQPREGTIDAPVGRDPRNRKRMSVHGTASRSARTSYEVLEYLPEFTFLQARLHTGRTHQIRAHFAAIGHALAGDRTYGGAHIPGLERQFLHARRLKVLSPSSGRELEFTTSLPPDLQHVLERLRGSL
jgi:23S rRNA pseudouridine1911/1915/1917 synthase